MKAHNPELVGALLDGELKGLQRWLVQRHVDRCAICAAAHRHQRHVREMLAGHPPAVPPMSDSPDFFWSKIKREIQAEGDQQLHLPVPRLSPWDWMARRRYALAGVTACLVAAVATVWLAQRIRVAPDRPAAVPSHVITLLPVTIEHVSTFIPNSVATPVETKDDDDAVIWVSGLPWTPDMLEMMTVYANLDS